MPDEFFVSDLAGTGGGDLESAVFTRSMGIEDGDDYFAIGDGAEPFLITYFDSIS